MTGEGELSHLIKTGAKFADDWFARTGVLSPMYHAITESGEHLLIGNMPPDKDMALAYLRELFAERLVVRYLYMDEAWIRKAEGISPAELEAIGRRGVKNDPLRIEVVIFIAEDRQRCVIGQQAITRARGEKPKLGPLEIDQPQSMSGRMIGLLASAGTTQ
jgi:hypothetical protein